MNNSVIPIKELMKMQKDEIIAYAITESVSDPVMKKDIEECKDGSLHYLRIPATLQTFDVLNRNRRDYGGTAMRQGLEAENVQELILRKSWFGEAGHPMTDKMERILTIDPTMISHRIKSIDIHPKYVNGVIETLDNGGYGNHMTRLILSGMEPAFSLRALAPLIKRNDGTTLIRSKPRIVTYDWVIYPSHKEAYQDISAPIQRVVKDARKVGNVVTESAVPVTESQILDFISDESSNIKLVSSFCEAGLGDMRLTSDGSFVIVKEGNTQFAVSIEDKIKHEITSYMAKF